MFKKSLSILLVLVVMISLVLVGCGQTTEQNDGGKTDNAKQAEDKQAEDKQPEKAKITMTSWLEVEQSVEAIFKEMIDAFRSANPDIEVETIGLPFNQYKDQLLVMSTSGNAPDVVMGNSQMMVGFNGAGILAPLEDLISKEKQADIFDNNLAGGTFDGKLVAIPWITHPIGLFYNKELFEKAGLDPEKAPETWDEMVQAAKKVAALKQDKDGNRIYGIGHSIGKVAHAGSVFNGIIYSHGGHFLDAEGKVDFDNAGTREAMQYIKDMVDAGVMPAGVNQKEIRGLFANEQLGIMFDGDMGRAVFRKLSGKGKEFDKIMGVALIPTGKTGKSETVYTEHQLGIAKESNDQEAAAKLIEHLLSKEMIVRYHETNSVLAPSKSIGKLPEMNEDYYMEVFNKQLERARPLPATHPMFDNAMLEVTKALERVSVGKEDVDPVVKETQQKIESLYSK